MIVWVLLGVILVLAGVVVWLLRPGPRRGGSIDLTAAAARGELDLRWDWPASDTGRVVPLETGDDLRHPSRSAA
jgi:hypothetical protein